MLGGFLALLAAATFAVNNVSARRGVVSGSVFQALAITIPIGVPLFAIAVTITGSWGALWKFSTETIAFLALAGIVHFVWGRYCLYRSTKAMGAILVGPVQQVALIIALILAILLLGEKLTPLRLFGLALVLGGPVLALKRTKKKKPASAGAAATGKDQAIQQSAPAFVPNYAEGYTWAILSALGTGLSPILVRYGLQNAGVGASLVGGLISYIAATIVFAIVLLIAGRVGHVLTMDRTNAKWFTFAGFFVFLSQMLRYMAFVFAPVTVVTPIQRLTSLFRIYFSWIINREHEVFDGRVILATIVSLIGAIALSVSTEAVLQFVPLPDWLVTIARWQWP